MLKNFAKLTKKKNNNNNDCVGIFFNKVVDPASLLKRDSVAGRSYGI